MNLKMKTLAAAMIAAGTLGTAQAGQILFPYVVNGGAVTTIVSVIDTTTYRGPQQPKGELHWVLWYKSGANAEVNTASCDEVNQNLPTSTNDIQTVDLGGKFGSTTKGVLFNDPSINNNWKVTNKNFAMAKFAQPLRGYMVVDNERGSGQEIEGEAMVLEFATGASWGYTAGIAAGEGDFTQDDNITFTPGQRVSIKPWGETTTKFFVTPINSSMISGNSVTSASPYASRGVALYLEGSYDGNTVAMFDRDENPVSGSVKQYVNCVGAVDVKSMLSIGALSPDNLPDAGWGTLNMDYTASAVTGSVYPTLTEASVIKLDYNSKATFNGEAVVGTFNNAFQLR